MFERNEVVEDVEGGVHRLGTALADDVVETVVVEDRGGFLARLPLEPQGRGVGGRRDDPSQELQNS